ncbi:transcription factor mef2A-like [Rhagoletis pomonella]|uniref:transcription factor mef2A-like n=1 Tax=Rhagoletis pomonella TaxID=28610 RepID=UPI00177FDE40|nr:transcription factor mef2A-like [Rhagoletis pomonella]XP_036343127.1 transcription factor mef2A-like [Rhagoletis pomonella]XP_036343128.1 transcription factor mef2A-like [Rhagoletis pomonella]XP_036343130.1 transcription factor mef2A-like [Rhagoletis pomonella]XP_036343131.1 transcription factor mef2A-like [Rhagoletis pomonella]XP_036343132.1 transcription factor mef2A-like [Rhagoletis pomonella]XP_036343153.1 transcription factor mef2A-like [Rhagoletis pomonella]XP_036343154.1 transcript
MTKTSNKMSGITNNNNNNNNNINTNNNTINKLSEKFLSTNTTKNIEVSTLPAGANTTTTNNNNAISLNNPKSHSNDCDKITQQQFSAAISSKLQAPQSRRSLPAPSTTQRSLQQQHHHQQQQQQQQSVTTNSSVLPSANTITKYSSSATLPSHQLQTIATVHHHHSQQHATEATIAPSGTTKAAQPQQHHPTSSNNVKDHHHHHQPATLKHLSSESDGTITSAPLSTNSVTLQQQRNAYNLQALKAANHLKAPAHSIPPRYQPPPQPAGNQAGILKHISNLRSSGGGAESVETLLGQRPSAVGNKHQTTSNFDTTHFNLKYPPDIPQLSPVYIPDSLKLPGGSGRYLQTHQTLSQRQPTRLTGSVANPQYFYNSHQQQQQQQYRQQQVEQQQQQHQQDMLKFVRKTDQDHPSPNASITSSAAAVPTGGTRLTAEQNRQLQVRKSFHK